MMGEEVRRLGKPDQYNLEGSPDFSCSSRSHHCEVGKKPLFAVTGLTVDVTIKVDIEMIKLGSEADRTSPYLLKSDN